MVGVKDWISIVDHCGGRTSLVKLRVTTDPDCATETVIHQPIPNLSSAKHLKAIILDSCVRLGQVVPDVLPASLESFSFVVNDAAITNISSISFRGISKLNCVLLRGLMESLQELDLSGPQSTHHVGLREAAINTMATERQNSMPVGGVAH